MISHLYFLQHEPDNPHDTHTVAVKGVRDQDGTLQIVGHVPLTLSKARRSNISEGGRKKKKQGCWTGNSSYLFLFPQEAFKDKEINRTYKRQRG